MYLIANNSGMKKPLPSFIFFIFSICIVVIMSQCYSCEYDFPVIIYFYFVIIVLVAFYIFALIQYKQLKKQLQYKSFIDKHEKIAKEYDTKVYVIDATKENNISTLEQALPIVFTELEKRKEKEQ
jgi:hypothetical protein